MTIPTFIIAVFCAIGIIVSMNFIMDAIFKAMDSSRAVSYTHLTLPTTSRV